MPHSFVFSSWLLGLGLWYFVFFISSLSLPTALSTSGLFLPVSLDSGSSHTALWPGAWGRKKGAQMRAGNVHIPASPLPATIAIKLFGNSVSYTLDRIEHLSDMPTLIFWTGNPHNCLSIRLSHWKASLLHFLRILIQSWFSIPTFGISSLIPPLLFVGI